MIRTNTTTFTVAVLMTVLPIAFVCLWAPMQLPYVAKHTSELILSSVATIFSFGGLYDICMALGRQR